MLKKIESSAFKQWLASIRDNKIKSACRDQGQPLDAWPAWRCEAHWSRAKRVASALWRGFASLTIRTEIRWSCCLTVAIKAHRHRILQRPMLFSNSGEIRISEPFTAFDAAEYLDSDEAVRVFMADAFETADTAYIAHARAWLPGPGA